MFADGAASLYEWMRSGIPVTTTPRMLGAKRACTDGREILVSDAMYRLAVRPNDDESDRDARRIDVVVVDNLKRDYREALRG